jgi:uncharacterized protein YodC (DUF2158 family)
MKRLTIAIGVLLCILGVCLLSPSGPVPAAAETVTVEVLYMNHGPLRPTIRDLQELFARYKGKLNARWYDEEQKEGKAFEEDKGVHGHVPLLLLINGKKEFSVAGKTVIFEGFPSGSGPFKEVQGNWSLADLQWLLDSLTR